MPINLARRVNPRGKSELDKAMLYPKSSSRDVALIVTMYDRKVSRDGTQAYVNIEVNQHPDANPTLPPQTDARLATKMHNGRRVNKDYAISLDDAGPGALNDVQKLMAAARETRQPVMNKNNERIGYAYSVRGNVHLPYPGKRDSQGNAMAVEKYEGEAINQADVSQPDVNFNEIFVDFNSLKPGPELAPNFREAQIGASSVYGPVYREIAKLQKDPANKDRKPSELMRQAVETTLDGFDAPLSDFQQRAADRMETIIADLDTIEQQIEQGTYKAKGARVKVNPNEVRVPTTVNTAPDVQAPVVNPNEITVPEVDFSAEPVDTREPQQQQQLGAAPQGYLLDPEEEMARFDEPDFSQDAPQPAAPEMDVFPPAVQQVQPEHQGAQHTQQGGNAGYDPRDAWEALAREKESAQPAQPVQPQPDAPQPPEGMSVADMVRKRYLNEGQQQQQQRDNGNDFSL